MPGGLPGGGMLKLRFDRYITGLPVKSRIQWFPRKFILYPDTCTFCCVDSQKLFNRKSKDACQSNFHEQIEESTSFRFTDKKTLIPWSGLQPDPLTRIKWRRKGGWKANQNLASNKAHQSRRCSHGDVNQRREKSVVISNMVDNTIAALFSSFEQKFNCLICWAPSLRMIYGSCQHRLCENCLYDNEGNRRLGLERCPTCQRENVFPSTRPDVPEDNIEIQVHLGVRRCPHNGCKLQMWHWELQNHLE